MKVTVVDENDKIMSLEIDESEPVSTLQELIQIEFGIPIQQQSIMFGGKILQGNQIVKDTGIQNEDMIQVNLKIMQSNRNQQQSLQQALQNVLNGLGDPLKNPQLVQEAKQIKEYYTSNPSQLNLILHQNRELAEAILSDNQQDLFKIFAQKEIIANAGKNLKLQSDPMNPEYQKEIEKMLQQQNIEHQRELAMEEHPEFFGRISMLYIEININGHPIQAFVDSGAESTIMSKQLCEQCGLMRLLDTRFAGMALGVGTSKILGRIHLAQMEILDKKLPVNLTILEDDKIQFLLGLDTLKRYQAIMDLGQRNLTFILEGNKLTVPFLSDGQIKKHVSISQESALFEENKIQEETNNNKQSSSSQQSGSKFPQESIDQLMDLGATKQEAEAALKQSFGDVNVAASIISQQKFGF